MSTLFGFLHHLAAFTLVSAIAVEFALIRQELTASTARKLLTTDAVYGIAAGALLVIGLLRVFYFEKGAAYYFSSHAFLAKLSVFIVVGVPLCFVAARYPGGDGTWKTVSEVTGPVMMNIVASLALVIGGVFAASAMGGVAFDEPVPQVIYKLCAVALAPGALGQLALFYFGGPGGMENVNGGLMGTFVSLACYFALFMALFRLPLSDQFVCVVVIFIIRAAVAYMMFRLQGAKNMNDI